MFQCQSSRPAVGRATSMPAPVKTARRPCAEFMATCEVRSPAVRDAPDGRTAYCAASTFARTEASSPWAVSDVLSETAADDGAEGAATTASTKTSASESLVGICAPIESGGVDTGTQEYHCRQAHPLSRRRRSRSAERRAIELAIAGAARRQVAPHQADVGHGHRAEQAARRLRDGRQ